MNLHQLHYFRLVETDLRNPNSRSSWKHRISVS